MQGRFDEAEELLDGFEDDPAVVEAAVSRSGSPAASRSQPPGCSSERLDAVGGESLLAAPLLARLVEAQLAAGPPRRAPGPRPLSSSGSRRSPGATASWRPRCSRGAGSPPPKGRPTRRR